tara:strand:- start:1748 stop:2425 length:678 start_codon:yes stop_codon:yes gene_type:complete
VSEGSHWAKPAIEVVLEEELGPEGRPEFLRLRRRRLHNRLPDGRTTASYVYDSVDRGATDAVILVLHHRGPRGREVLLRTSIRPPLAFRRELTVPLHRQASPVIWELPAGLVEPAEIGEEGLLACAARETLEEAGFDLAPGAFRSLGPSLFLSPGVLAERIYFYEAEVDPATRGVPTEDGSPVEEGAAVRFFDLDEALATGPVQDVKTELGLRRLRERYPGEGAP